MMQKLRMRSGSVAPGATDAVLVAPGSGLGRVIEPGRRAGRWARRCARLAFVAALAAAACTSPGGPAPKPTAHVVRPLPAVLPTRPPPSTAPTDGSSDPAPDPVYPDRGSPSIDVRHYDLALDWSPQTTVLTGAANLRIRAVWQISEIVLDLGEWYTVDGATVDGAAVTASRPRAHSPPGPRSWRPCATTAYRTR